MKRVTAALLALACVAHVALAPAAPRKKPKPKPAPKPDVAAPANAADESPAPKRATPSGASDVTVVDVAGDLAYVKPGASAGIKRGSQVLIRGKAYKVIGATATYAVVLGGPNGPREGDRGAASAAPERADEEQKLPEPRPLAQMERAWPAPIAPASLQNPKPIPLGAPELGGKYRVLLSATALAFVPLEERRAALAHGELRARVHAAPFSAPVTFDADAALVGYAANDLSDRAGSRPLLRVRELLLGYGKPRAFNAGLGRMRYAASTLGTLDGVRAEAPLGAGFSLGAFGGVLPDPLSGGVALDAQRFGVEARYLDTESALRPEAALVTHASTFQGKLDERRVSAVAAFFPGSSRIGGHVEVSSFDDNNPWKAAPIEVTAAGVDGSLRAGAFQIGGRLDVRQQERSMYLASFLPLSWFCTTSSNVAAGAPDTCVDGRGSQRMLESVDVSVELGHLGLMLGGTAQQTASSGPDALGAFANARVVRIARHFRVEASGHLSKGTLMDLLGASAGPGLTLFGDALDVSAYYRQARLAYRSLDEELTQHAVGSMIVVLPASEVVVTLQGEGQTGDDVKALLALLNVLWRPR